MEVSGAGEAASAAAPRVRKHAVFTDITDYYGSMSVLTSKYERTMTGTENQTGYQPVG